ncbi:MAG: hypothetical protein AAF483_20510 [Planctomycetota bacterium]
MRRWSALSAFALIAVTYPLWISAPETDSFPQIPLFESLTAVPIWIDWIALAMLLLGWLMIARKPGWVGPSFVLVTAVLLVLLNQHRLQPWHYQLTIFATIFFFPGAELRQRLFRWIVASIYLYSALGKLDFEFLHTVGMKFVDAMLDPIGGADQVSGSVQTILVLSMPAVEFLVGFGVLWRRTRRIAGVLACLMHLGLIVLLSPLGLDHSLGVLLWNVHFIGVAILIFVLPKVKPRSDSKEEAERNPKPTSSEPARRVSPSLLPKLLLAPVVFLPLLERFGLWDHWPSWALYAPHSSRVTVEVAYNTSDRLPENLQPLMPEETETQLWVRVPLDEWSLRELGVPIYPQARFQAGVSRVLAERFQSPFEIRATLLGSAARLDGKRLRKEFAGSREINKIESEFWFGSKHRKPAEDAKQ